VHSLHAAVEYALRYPELTQQWDQQSKTVVLLTVKDEKHLQLHAELLELEGPVAWFREPDLGDQLTAVACLAGSRRLSNLPLLRGGEEQ
jgi:hypothetical protein